MTRPGIEPWSPGPLANTLLIQKLFFFFIIKEKKLVLVRKLSSIVWEKEREKRYSKWIIHSKSMLIVQNQSESILIGKKFNGGKEKNKKQKKQIS